MAHCDDLLLSALFIRLCTEVCSQWQFAPGWNFCFVGSSSAWPTSFSVAAGSSSSSDSMSVSDDEEAKTAFNPSMLVSRFVDQAKDLTQQPFNRSSRGTAVQETEGPQLGSAVSDFASTMMSRAMQFTGQRFGASSFSPNGGSEHVSSRTIHFAEHCAFVVHLYNVAQQGRM